MAVTSCPAGKVSRFGGFLREGTNKKGLTFDGKTLDVAEDLFFYLPGLLIIFLSTFIYYPVQTPIYNEIKCSWSFYCGALNSHESISFISI